MNAIVAPASNRIEPRFDLLDDDDLAWFEGEIRERTRKHGRVEARFAKFLDNWLDTQPEPRGEIVSGRSNFRLRGGPESGVGIDVAYVSGEVADRTSETQTFIEGPPILAVEIPAPSDRYGTLHARIDLFLKNGVLIVWVISVRFHTVTVYRPDAKPALFSASQELTAEPHLPGFRVAVAKLFGR